MNMLANFVRNPASSAEAQVVAPAPPLVAVVPVVPVVPVAPIFAIVAHQITASGRPAFRISRGNGHLETLYDYEMTVAEKAVLADYRAQASGVAWVTDDVYYDVSRIVDHRRVGTKLIYLIEWEGAEWSDPVWRSEQLWQDVDAHEKVAAYFAGATQKTEEQRQLEKPIF